METMTQADFARRHDVSRKTVTVWKKDGLIAMAGDLVDVEASDERLRKYRFAEDGRAQRGAKKQAARLAAAPSGRVKLTLAELEQRLRGVDWTQEFDWSDEAQAERARMAARCIGWQAVESDLRDDGHHGGIQLRDPRWVRDGRLLDGAVIGGYGFELSAFEVLQLCRHEVTPEHESDGDLHLTVDTALLIALAYPHHQAQKKAKSIPQVVARSSKQRAHTMPHRAWASDCAQVLG